MFLIPGDLIISYVSIQIVLERSSFDDQRLEHKEYVRAIHVLSDNSVKFVTHQVTAPHYVEVTRPS